MLSFDIVGAPADVDARGEGGRNGHRMLLYCGAVPV
jgi:hypothetical protein